MASSYLTYKTPSYNDLIGGTPQNLLPKWLFDRPYTPLPDVMAEAEKMGVFDFNAKRRGQEEEAIAKAEEIFANPEVGPEKPLDVGLGQLEQELYKLGLVDNAQELTKRRQTEQAQAIQLQRIEEEMDKQRRREEAPQYKRFGDMIYRISPDGRLEADRPVIRQERPERQKEEKKSVLQEVDEMLGEKKAEVSSGPGLLDQAGAWLSGMLNQPTVNPRARATPVPLDTGASISGNPQRRVITVRRKAIEQ
jgi:hypothetical protein